MDTDVKKDGARASRRVDCLGSGKGAEMPDIYAEKRAVEETSVEVAPSDVESPGIDRSRGFNPYDTGRFLNKK
jgi:hypothetical protein